MKRRLAFFILFILLLTACGTGDHTESYSLSVWYAEDGPLADVFVTLTEEYNAQRERGALPVSLRAFADEAALRRALESGARPDLLLCGHTLALSLYERGELRECAASSSEWPVWLTERSESVGHGFYPLGFSLPLLCAREETEADLIALLRRASEAGQGSGEAFLGVDAFAPLFYQTLLDRGAEFTADAARDSLNDDYAVLFNAFMEAAFDGGMADITDDSLSCLLGMSPALRTLNLSGFTVAPLSAGELLAEGEGIAVTCREPRSERELPRFLRWLLQSERLGQMALAAGMIPSVGVSPHPDDPLEGALAALVGRPLHLPDPDSPYERNRAAFETDFAAARNLLH